ncbi:MAG: amidohydrolase family protein [Gemmatimonadetes bacterium]|nr:amidohydrolase family protein [Gemmatimonadota bacterium]MXX71825.1 amidohydrolase family protein [Gemmatimonadota bacterium]MYC93241.1 amidohydrolase family protein [Gemmatimonadota bacterium]MYG35030.1 amidohydrolase family protein [Gemmatimonadota bacterium]
MRHFPFTAALVATAALAAVPPQPAATQSQPAIAIVGATIIDGNGGPPLTDGTLVTGGDRIAAVGPRASVQVPEGATVIDGAGRYVTPGFIDTNVHLSLYSGHETLVRYEDRNAALTLEAAQMQLKHGFTTVRDSYGSLLPLMEIRDAIARGDTIGPRMLVAGNIVGWGGPYTVSFSLIRPQGLTLFQEQFNDFITQGSGEEWMEMEPEDLRVAVNRYLDLGPDFLKYGGTGHFSNPVMIGFSPAAQRVLVEETRKRGLIAETHSTSPEGLRMSVEAGLDLIQHPEVLTAEMSDALVKEIADRGIVCSMLTNTITGKVWQEHVEAREKALAGDGGEDENRREGLAKTSVELRAERRAAGESMEIRRRNAEKLIAAGCVSTIGTDNYLGAAPEFRREKKAENQSFGIGSVIATEGLVELGMTPMEAITSVTRNGAIASGMLDELGTLEAGKYADVLVLDADPLADIGNIRALGVVIRDGKIVDLDALPYERIFSSPGKGHAWE